jgi:hypothetical protein
MGRAVKETPVYYIHHKDTFYQGHWKEGLPHGYGRVLYPD